MDPTHVAHHIRRMPDSDDTKLCWRKYQTSSFVSELRHMCPAGSRYSATVSTTRSHGEGDERYTMRRHRVLDIMRTGFMHIQFIACHIQFIVCRYDTSHRLRGSVFFPHEQRHPLTVVTGKKAFYYLGCVIESHNVMTDLLNMRGTARYIGLLCPTYGLAPKHRN